MKKNDILTAIRALKQGELILYPTDTLYALGADIFNESAVQKVFQIKQRPYTIPLPVAVASIKEIESIAWMNEPSRRICKTFLPGKLTIVLKKKPHISTFLTSGSDTIAIRVPRDPIALELLSRFGPLTVTSANLHHMKTKSLVEEILQQLKTSFPVCIHDGRRQEAASTIIDLSEKTPRVVREGSISEKQLLDVIAHG
jgi:L-threonylcarbamoyladenylate synthase